MDHYQKIKDMPLKKEMTENHDGKKQKAVCVANQTLSVVGVMAESVQNINPSVLKWARARKHYLHADVVEKFHNKSVTEEVLIDWEEGRNSPTYPQLEKLADCYKVPVAVFFFPEPPEIEDAVASLRSTPGFDLDLIAPATLDVIHRVQATQMALREFNDGVNPVPNPLHKFLRLPTNENIESLATKLRGENFLNVSLEDQQGWSTYMDALEAWRDAIEGKGIFVFRWPFKSEYLSGFCLYDEEFPVICLDSQETKGRQIFTLLHELAHLLHGESSVTLDNGTLEIREDDIQESEYYFDRIAGAMLVPINDLKKQVSKGNMGHKDFYAQKASLYKVTPLMFLMRCRVTNLVSYDVFMDVKESLKAHSGEDRRSSGGDYYWNYLSYWGKAFLRNILSKRHQNRISEYEVSRVLNMKIKNVEKLEGYLIDKQLGNV